MFVMKKVLTGVFALLFVALLGYRAAAGGTMCAMKVKTGRRSRS
jgi:hypothetical protein